MKDGSRDGLQDHHTHDQTLITDFNSEIVVTVNKSDLGQNERLNFKSECFALQENIQQNFNC
jgi:hypothetical protein